MRVLSLFAGVGGFDLGLEQAGMETVAQVEWDRRCQKVLARHWPEVPKWSDVQDCRAAELPDCDLVAFGSPCQDLSVAGKRAGLDGSRSSMFYEATRLIREFQDDGRGPTWAVWENVVGALTSNDGRDFGAVLDDLADCGAVDLQWRVLDSRWFGVAQQRRRVFLVARFDPRASSAEQVLPLGPGRGRDPLAGAPAGPPVQAAPRDGSPHDGGGAPGGRPVRDVGSAYPASDKPLVPGRLPAEMDGITGTIASWQSSTGNMQVDSGFVVPMMLGGDADPGLLDAALSLEVPAPDDVTAEELEALAAAKLPLAVADEPVEDWPSQRMWARKLTPREAERLMGWPDDWTRWAADGSEIPDAARYKMCSNGVASPVAAWLGARVMEADSRPF